MLEHSHISIYQYPWVFTQGLLNLNLMQTGNRAMNTAKMAEDLVVYAGSKCVGLSTYTDAEGNYQAQFHLKDGTAWISQEGDVKWKCTYVPLWRRIWNWILSKL